MASLGVGLVLSGTVGARHKRGQKNHGVLKAKLKGENEVPGPGDPDGRGKALVKLLPRFGAVCFALDWRDIGDPTAAHIHRGAKGVAGPVVVTLFAGEVKKKGCTDGLDEDLIREIRRKPREFYVNVHNAAFPDGAIRGQLRRSGRHRGHRRGAGKERRYSRR